MSRLLIAGCGYVGSALGRAASAEGWEVFGIRRRVAAPSEGIEYMAADLTDPDVFRSLPGGIEWMVYAASADEFTEDAYRRCHGTAFDNVAEAMRAQKRLRGAVLLSSTSVYERAEGAWVDEQSPTAPSHFSGQAMLRAEASLRRIPCRTVALRLGYIYGPGRSGIIEAALRGGDVATPGQDHIENFIHVGDCVRAIQFVMAHPSPADLYVLVDEEPALRSAVLEWIRAAAGGGERVPGAPPGVERKPPRGNKRCSSARLRQAGFRFRWRTYREGLFPLLPGATGTGARTE